MIELNAVFEGGGIRGIGLVGALTVFEERQVSFHAVGGTSAGAMVAALYAAGYSAEELKKILFEVDFSALLDPSWPQWRDLLFHYGRYKGKKLQNWFYELLHEKGIVTFEDLANGGKKDLHIIASDLTNKKILHFNKDLTRTTSIAEAVRMSVGIPLFFEAYKWGVKLVVDGGILSNYPLWIFKDSERRTIGFKLVSSAEQGIPEPPGWLWPYLQALAGTMMEARDKEDAANPDRAITVHIPTGGISATTFNLRMEDKQLLFSSGRAAAEGFLKGEGRRFLVAGVPTDVTDDLKRTEETIDRLFKDLPRIGDTRTTVAPGTTVSSEVQQAWEAAEEALIRADHLRVPDRKKLARYFVEVGVYYTVVRRYDRAEANVRRAVELDPDSPQGWRQLGRVLAYQAAGRAPEDATKSRLLDEAEAAVVRAAEKQDGHTFGTLHDLAWIFDERGEFSRAIDLYRDALKRAQEKGKPPGGPLDYNLACALAKAGGPERQEEALSVLRRVRKDIRQWAETDPDFKALRESPMHQARFRDALAAP